MKKLQLKKYSLIILSLCLALNASAIDKIQVVGLFKDKAILTIDGKQRLLKKGKTSPEGVLLISASSKEAIIEVDGEQRTLQLGSHISSQFQQTTERKTVTIAPTSNGMYFVTGSINGFQVDFLVDTGATAIAMNKHDAKKIGINYKLDGKKSLVSTASGVETSYNVNLKRVRVGDIELQNIRGAVLDGDHPTEVLLGNTFLGKLDIQRQGRVLKLIK